MTFDYIVSNRRLNWISAITGMTSIQNRTMTGFLLESQNTEQRKRQNVDLSSLYPTYCFPAF